MDGRAGKAGTASRSASQATAYTRGPMLFDLSADQREIQSLAREVAEAEIVPNAAEWDRLHGFPRELLGKLAGLGLLGVCIPEEYGGAGADFLSYILVLEELSRADAGVGVTVAVHTSAVALPIVTFGSDEQRSRFVPPLARATIGCADGARRRLDAGSLRLRAESKRRRLADLRLEAMDHERRLRRDGPALRENRSGHARAEGRLGVHPRRRPGQGHARGGEVGAQLIVDGRPGDRGRGGRT